MKQVDRRDFELDAGSAYLHGPTDEQRSQLEQAWVDRARANGVKFAQVSAEGRDQVWINAPEVGVQDEVFHLRDRADVLSLLRRLGERIYVDTTGLSHSTWAPLLRAAVDSDASCDFIYVEPASYQRNKSPSPGNFYDLSERFGGIAPLPGFANIRRRSSSPVRLVPFLGFEGLRLDHVMASTEASVENVVPIVGVPGFRVEYPHQAYLGNRENLRNGFAHSRIRFAKANCPFSAFLALARIADNYPDELLHIAPIGTKPHAVGAVLFALAYPDRTQLIYDHPVRKPLRTMGEARVCVYEVKSFWDGFIMAQRP